MEFIEGTALSKIAAKMLSAKVEPGSPEAVLLGQTLLSALTDAYGSMIFGSGIIHGDPHPGNIFIMEEGKVALLDCGQVKILNTSQKLGLAKLIVMVNEWEKLDIERLDLLKAGKDLVEIIRKLENQTKILADTVKSFGVTFKEGVGDECAAAVAILLFGNTGTVLPGGYAGEEIR